MRWINSKARFVFKDRMVNHVKGLLIGNLFIGTFTTHDESIFIVGTLKTEPL